MKRLSLCWACIAVLVGFGKSATGQSTSTLAGQVDLPRLVDAAAQRLRVNIEYDASALKGQVTLRLEGGLSDEELWQLVNRVLAARGFTTVRQSSAAGSPPAYSVVKLSDAPAVAGLTLAPEGSGPAAPGSGGPPAGFQTVVVRARNRSARDLVEQLGRGLGGGRGAGPAAASLSTLGDSGLIVISDLGARVEQTARLLSLLDTPESRTVVEPIAARNLGATQLLALVTQVAAKSEAVSGERLAGEFVAAADGNSLLLVAPRSAVPRWRALVEQLDQREAVETATYTPRHFPAPDVARLIDRTIKPGVGGISGGATPSGGVSDDRFRVVVDELTGSLVVTATPTQQAEVRALLDRLASVPASARRPVRTFVVRNRPVDEVAGVLGELLRAGVLEAAAAGGATEGSASAQGAAPAASPAAAAVTPMPPRPAASTPGVPSAAGATVPSASTSTPASPPRPSASSTALSPPFCGGGSDEPPVTLTVDKGTNTLVAVGEPRILEQIEKLLATLDVRQPQVMLEVLLVTLSDGQTLDLGVELQKLEVSGGTLIRLSSLFGLGTTTAGGDRDGPAGASGFTGVVLNPGDFSVVLRALETINDGRAVSMPRLLVGNNEQATLDSTVQQPYASLNTSNTVSTTSFGGTQDAGTVVTIQPQIAEGDHLLLQYSVSLSAFTGPASNPALPPPRQQNRVQSTATIPDGFTVVVGGIEIENRSKAVSQVPLLGSIPIIGEAFKNRNKSDTRSRFYVFIRANILRGSGAGGGFEDLKYLSERDARGAGVDDGWPRLDPRVIR